MPRPLTTDEPVSIPAGEYWTVAQIARRHNVTHLAVQKWIDKGWLPALHIPGLGRIVATADLVKFTPPGRGRRSGAGRHKQPVAKDVQ